MRGAVRGLIGTLAALILLALAQAAGAEIVYTHCGFGTLAGIEIKGSKKELDSKQASGQLAANGSKTVKLKFSSGVLKTVKKALSKHKQVTAFILVEAKDVAGKEISAHTSFTVKP